MRYKSLTSFYGSVERALAFHENGDPRYFNDVQSAVQAAIKIGETGPFTLVTRVELIPDAIRGDQSRDGPPPIYWEPIVKKAPDPDQLARVEARRSLQSDLNDALIAQGMRKGEALSLVQALPGNIDNFDDAFRWASRRK